jgi:hypothetical protein
MKQAPGVQLFGVNLLSNFRKLAHFIIGLIFSIGIKRSVFSRSNALIKRASVHIQQCSDPERDSMLSFSDFDEALKADPTNPDVYFHRGQVSLESRRLESGGGSTVGRAPSCRS